MKDYGRFAIFNLLIFNLHLQYQFPFMLEEGQKNILKSKILTLRFLIIFLSLFFCLSVALPALTQAPALNTGIEQVGNTINLADTDIRIIIAKIIRIFLGLLGLIALCFTIYGGYMYMTSGGNEEQVATAKKILKNMGIGLAIILSSFAIVQFILNALYEGYNTAGQGAENASGFTEEFRMSGFLGSVIESHYPMRNAVNIPRNTSLAITFRQPMLAESLITNGYINSQNIKIYQTANGESTALGLDPAITEDDVVAVLSYDGRTVLFQPNSYLGNNVRDVNYTVRLNNGVKLANGSSAFSNIANYYSWQFTVSTKLDLTPPEITSVIPVPKADRYAPNILVQINFNEAVNPIASAGKTTLGFNNITTKTVSDGVTVAGEYQIANQYQTVEFKSDSQCGVNPCGQPIYCLPYNADIEVKVKSSTVNQQKIPQTLLPPTGVVDMAGNVLNGGGTLSMADGQLHVTPGVATPAQYQADSTVLLGRIWQFQTSSEPKTTAPVLSSIFPGSRVENVDPTMPLQFTFNDLMSVVGFRDIRLKTDKSFNVWYTPKAVVYPTYTVAELWHGDFWKSPLASDTKGATYYPFVPSSVNDIYQNCFYKAEGENCTAGALSATNPSCADGVAKPGNSVCDPVTETNCPYKPNIK